MSPSNDNHLSERDEQRLRAAENTAYSYKIISYSALLLAAIALGVAAVSVVTANDKSVSVMPMSRSSHPLSSASVAPVSAVAVAMHDPGCHWFQVGQAFQKSETVSGPTQLTNSDEDTINIAGPHGVQSVPVGQKITLAPGAYTITMVGQAPDDNTLHLSVT
jgi:hypothetical protein